jgi:hypothetical protein
MAQTLAGDKLLKYSVELSDEQLARLKQLAEEQGITANLALQKAITTESYIRNKLKEGNKILVQTPDNQFYQLTFF